ncbi:MgtC/SapB family protein [Alcaligenaceae bacterium]|nr:MgtC/SapB family protein [Alcaligenaceae bacterium]
MQIVQYANFSSLLDTLVSLTTAFLLGGAIGLERQIRQRTAGLRTNVLVCVGAALFVDVAVRYYELHGGGTSPLHVIAYVVSGVGFLGAGVIMREEGNVRGINTAATLWGSAAVGSAAGADLFFEAVLGALFVLAANTLLRPVVDRINREPIDVTMVEATYSISLVADMAHRDQARASLEEVFSAGKLPLRDIEIETLASGEVQIEAALLPMSVDGDELDALLERLRSLPHVRQVFWSASTVE